LAAGGPAASELNGILGKPLDHAEREKVLDIVRSNGGVKKAIEHARGFVSKAHEACGSLPSTTRVSAMRDAPVALLDSVS